MLSLPTNVLLLISGNNFHPKGDLYRRILTTRIDPESNSPERRCFRLDPLEYCREHRHTLVAAGFTLLLGFVSAGKPRLTKDRLASFEKWDDMIRQCVLWLAQKGVAELGDPTVCIDTAKEQEPERQKLGAFLEAAASVMQGDWRAADLIRRSGDMRDDGGNWNSALQDALEEIAGERGTINPRILGRWIERHDGARCAGFFLERRGARQRAALWRICRYDRWSGSTENNSLNSRNSQTGLSLAFKSAGAESSEIAFPTGLTAANDHLAILFSAPSLAAANGCG